ncbi:MAG: DinB family protein [Gemmatimonadetes bacterium]|nr:DinB family protein [Gemmatimonadota bacterium]
MRRLIVLTLMLCAQPVAAQQAPGSDPADAAIASIRIIYERVKDNILRAAEMMSENDYQFRPTADVRTFGELIGHIANGNYAFCAAARGEDNPNQANIERTVRRRAELIRAVTASFAWCDPAYQLKAQDASGPAFLMGTQRTRFDALVFNNSHDDRHYGNIVTYMRLRGLVPPSSTRTDTTRAVLYGSGNRYRQR